MHDFEQEGLLPEDEAVEIVDLEPAEEMDGVVGFWSARRFLSWQRSWSRRRYRVVTTLSMGVLIVGVLLYSIHGNLPFFSGSNSDTAPSFANLSLLANNIVPAPMHISPELELLPQEDGIACLFDAEWSPNSTLLAFLGYARDCVYGSHVYEQGVIAIYSSSLGKLVQLISPDSAIFQMLHERFPAVHTALDIYYSSLLWSPDGRQIALPFSMGLPTHNLLPVGNIEGVALIDIAGGDVHVLLTAQTGNGGAVEWDLQQRRAMTHVVVPSPLPTTNRGTNIPEMPAFAYHWGANGALVPDFIRGHYLHIPKSKVGKSQIGRVGNPDGDASFTIWQPGTGMVNTEDSAGDTYAAGIFTWNTNFAAWSPDGRYIISSVNLQGILQIPDHPLPDQQTLAKFHMDRVPYFPVRDVALQNMLQTLNASNFTVLVAWQPAGYVLAAYDYGMIDLDLYDSVTGAEVALLALPDELRTDLEGTAILRWSPDGKRVLLFDADLSTVTVWNVSKVEG